MWQKKASQKVYVMKKEAKAYFELAKIHIIKNQKEKAILDINNAIRKNSKILRNC